MSPRVSLSDLFLRAQTDERLAGLAAEGNGRAFAVLVERHRRTLLGHARRLVGVERGEDVLQQALLRAWSAMESGTEVRHAAAWLHRILHHAALAELGRAQRVTEPLDDQLVDRASVELAAEQRLELHAVLAGVASLPERQRIALLGSEIDGRSRRQLAAELGLSEGAVRQLVHRARAGVRAAVAAVVPWPLVLRALRGSAWLDPDRSTALAPLHPAGEALVSSAFGGGAAKLGAVLIAGALGGGIVVHSEITSHRQPRRLAARISHGAVAHATGARANATVHAAASVVSAAAAVPAPPVAIVTVAARREAPVRADDPVTAVVPAGSAARPSASGGLAGTVTAAHGDGGTEASDRREERASAPGDSAGRSTPSRSEPGDGGSARESAAPPETAAAPSTVASSGTGASGGGVEASDAADRPGQTSTQASSESAPNTAAAPAPAPAPAPASESGSAGPSSAPATAADSGE